MVIEFKNISKKFNSVNVLEDISFSLEKNEILCILGPSGCGKTTLLNIISGLVFTDSGILKKNSEKLAYIFQEDRLLPWKTLYENIIFVNEINSKEKVYKLIDSLGLKGFEDYYPEELSGGMKQRGSIARAFNYEAELLLMDEPFKSLDYTLTIKLIKQLIELWKDNKNSIIFITHDIDEAILIGNKIMVLSDKPSQILKNFEIKIKQENRKLNDSKLVEIRNEIIDLLL